MDLSNSNKEVQDRHVPSVPGREDKKARASDWSDTKAEANASPSPRGERQEYSSSFSQFQIVKVYGP